ncbi:bifunctional 2-polyprenyl-6-hydroxyphenol methylase/3-demethylubiquinol 3-O-methyltransferase UbiG [Herminiimonas sp. CN]|uniref:class I SAM-dependent methyltransferase n=1 Tax=Herminiimonas sp. CN TaxID=1349818 RepID=UPI00047345B1|nr:class I SAM-dependent methyltransferase [Herminiimonas sp. CN]
MKNTLDNHVQAYQGLSIYDFDNTIQLKWYPQRVVQFSKGATSLLELGLGHGITTGVFEQHFKRHVVVDASPAVIENFRQRYPRTKVEIAESYFETFDTSERFDVIVFGYILEHVDDPISILKHFRSFLAPGGRMFVTVPNAEVLNRRLGHLAGLLPDMQQLSDHDLLLGHKRYYTVESLQKDIQQAGYEIQRLEGIYLKPLTTSQMISLNLNEDVIQALCLAAIDYPELSCGILAELALSDG